MVGGEGVLIFIYLFVSFIKVTHMPRAPCRETNITIEAAGFQDAKLK